MRGTNIQGRETRAGEEGRRERKNVCNHLHVVYIQRLQRGREGVVREGSARESESR